MMLCKKEKKIITDLRNNGREAISKIARKHNLPISSVADKLHKLEDRKIISHKTFIDFEKIGFMHTILANIRGAPGKREQISSWLERIPNVNTIREINDGFDFHIEAIFENKKQKHDFIRNLQELHEGIDVQVHEVINTLKHEQFLSNIQDHNFTNTLNE